MNKQQTTNNKQLLIFSLFFVLLANIGCNKSNKVDIPEIKEYFAPKDLKVKSTIKNFLIAANRVKTVSNKALDSLALLTNKEPNEGVWLMEAGANLERYGNLEMVLADTKIYNLEISNSILPSGIIEMDATDIILEYNALLTDIIADEVDFKVAQLIDFKIIEILADVTKVRVEVDFGFVVEPNVLLPGTIIYSPTSINNCDYLYPSGYTAPTTLYDFSSFPYTKQWAFTFEPHASFNPGTMSWVYNEVAKANHFYNYTQYSTSSTVDYYIFNGVVYEDYIPYTNINIVNTGDLTNILGCRNIRGGGPMIINAGYVSESSHLVKYKYMTDVVKANLPNNIYNDLNYSLVHGLLQEGSAGGNGYPTKVEIRRLSFVHYSNN